MDGPKADRGRTDPEAALVERIAALEARVSELEAALAGSQPAVAPQVTPPPAIPAVPPPPPAAWGAVAAAVAPSRTPLTTGWAASSGLTAVASPAPAPAASPAAGPRWGSDPTWQAAAPASQPARLSVAELSDRFAGRLLAWTGALALVGAAIFFLSLAFSRGWIGEEARVAIGLLGGVAAFVAGGWLLVRGSALMGRVLTAIGLGVFTIAVMAATRLYALVPPEVGLLAALVASIAAAAIAVRTDARSVAAFGLVAALVAPPLLGASPTLLTLAFVAITLVGTTAIALFRSWSWLPPLAFVLAAPQLMAWLLAEAAAPVAIIALAGFWLLNVVAAAGEEVRIVRNELRPTSALLTVANAAFLAGGLLVVLDAGLEPWRGVAYTVAAAAHVAIGGWFLARQGLTHRFGSLVAGTGAAFLALAAVAQLGGAVVPAAWALEALVLVWLAVRLDYRYAAWGALVLGVMAIGHLVVVAYPAGAPGVLAGDPLTHESTVSLVVVVGSLIGAGVLVPVRWVASTLAGAAVLVAVWAGPYELSGSALVAWDAVLAVAAVGLHRAMLWLPERHVSFVRARPPLPIGPAEAAGAVAWVAGALTAVQATMAPRFFLDSRVLLAVPFTNAAALQAALLVGAGIAAAGITRSWLARAVALLAAIAAAAWAVPFQVGADLVVVLWCALAVAAWLVADREPASGVAFRAMSSVLAGGAAIVLFGVVAPPWRLMVQDHPTSWPQLLPLWWLSFAAMAAVLFAASRLPFRSRWRTACALAAAATVTYGASVGVVSAFQAAVGGPLAHEELAKQAQVALSVLWTSLGVIALVGGLAGKRPLLRDAGLALLAIATAKVFLVDLAALDVAYRVLSLAALGLLLLASAWLVTRFRGVSRAGSGGPAADPTDRA